MEVPQISVKSIPKVSFFELYNELSYRETEKVETPSSIHSSKELKNELSHSYRSGELTPSQGFQDMKLSNYLENPEQEEVNKDYIRAKRPPTELIAIDIPLKSPDNTAEFAESQLTSDFNSSYNQSINNSSFNQSFEVPKIPKSIESIENISKASSSLKQYMENLKDLDENESEPIIQALENCKLHTFDSLLELVFCECKQKIKTKGCLFIKCTGGDRRIAENKKLDFFYETLGVATFDINKLLHRSLLKKYLFQVTSSESVPPINTWTKLGFPDDINDFFGQTGSPLAFIIAIHVVEIITPSFWSRISELNTPFLDICFQLSIEAYQLSKISKLKSFFLTNIVPNYFKLTTAGILNFFMVKSCSQIDNYELLQRTVAQMRDNHEFLLNSIDSSIINHLNN